MGDMCNVKVREGGKVVHYPAKVLRIGKYMYMYFAFIPVCTYKNVYAQTTSTCIYTISLGSKQDTEKKLENVELDEDLTERENVELDEDLTLMQKNAERDDMNSRLEKGKELQQTQFLKKKASQENNRATRQLLAGLDSLSPCSPGSPSPTSYSASNRELEGLPSPPPSNQHSHSPPPSNCEMEHSHSPPLRSDSPILLHSPVPSPVTHSPPKTFSYSSCLVKRKRTHSASSFSPGDCSPFKRQRFTTSTPSSQTRQAFGDITNDSAVYQVCIVFVILLGGM